MRREQLSAYVAIDRRGASVDLDVTGGRCTGAALFADIAGFTPFTNELVRTLGPRLGAEELTRHLNQVYDALIDEVHAYAGTVVDFSGDAIMCWFDDAPQGIVGAASGLERARICAARQQRAMQRVGELRLPDGERFELSLKVGIASGPAHRLGVGDAAERVIDVLAGATVDRAVSAERRAARGDVILELRDDLASGEASIRLVDPVQDQPPRSPWPSTLGDDVALAMPWIDRRLRGDDAVHNTELRATVALFVMFGGIDFDRDAGAGRKLDAYVRWVQATLSRHDGLLVQVTLGDKGGYLYISFGAHRAHENLADRALAAALELRDPPSSCGLGAPPSIGLAQGIMRTGAYGGRERRTFGALGDATNLAARLMSAAAAGEILVTTRVRDAARARYDFEDLPPITVKGHDDPIAIVRLARRPVGLAVQGFGAMVSREVEVDALTAALAAVLRGPGGTIVVEGEPGIGKSHLIDAARRRLAAHGEVTWLTVETDDVPRGSLGALLPVLRDLFFLELAPDDDGRRALFELGVESLREACDASPHADAQVVAAAVLSEASFLGALVGVHWPDSPFACHETRTRHARCARAIDTFLRAEALRRPTVLHIRDAQWLDEESHELLCELGRSATTFPLTVLVDRRPPDRPDPLADLVGRTALHVRLGPLDAIGVRRLAASVLGSPVDRRLAATLTARTGGNPLFCEQLALDLRDRGLLTLTDGRYTLVDHDDHEVPLTLHATLASRLDRVDSPTRAAAQCAAVLGETFTPAVLAALLRAEGLPDDVDTLVADGEAHGLWHRLDDGRVQFRHVLVRETAYGMQLDERLVTRHRHAARAVAANGQPRDRAMHERRAGRPRRAAAAMRAAGRAAARAHRYREARDAFVESLTDATTASVDRVTFARLHESLAAATFATGEYEATASSLHAALALDPADARRRLHRRVRLGEALERWGRYSDADDAYEAALVDLRHVPDLPLASRIYGGLAAVRARVGGLDDAWELANLSIGFAGGDPELEADAHLRLCVIQWRRGELDDAARHGVTAQSIIEHVGDIERLAAVHNNLGLVHSARGDHLLAIDAFRAAVDAFDSCGNQHGLACALDNLAQCLVHTGHDDEAMPHLERAVSILSRIGIGSNEVFTAMWQAGSW